MTREITSAALTASQAETVRPVLMAEMDFSGGYVRANTSPYTLSFEGNDYLGVGNLGSIETITESSGLQALGIQLTLSGIPSEMIAIALGEHYQGRSCRIFMGLLDENHELIADPIEIFTGRMDTMDIESGTTSTITVSAESRLVDWERPRIRRYTDADLQREYPGDLGLEYVALMAEKEIIWGRA